MSRSETASLASLLRQFFAGETGSDAWHGPSLSQLVAGIDWEAARARPIPHGHTIWELVLHIAVWDEICVRRLAGEEIRTTTGSVGDWPEVGEESPAGWLAARERLERAQESLARAVAALEASALDRQVAGWPWSYRLMVHGTLHHDLYHAGQIARLRRALGLSNRTTSSTSGA